MRHELRDGAPAVEVFDKPKTVEAKWVLNSDGAPSKIKVPAGTGVRYREEDSIVHLRNDRAGWSCTYTPEVIATVNHGDPFFELEFCDPNQQGFMPSVAIGEYISFRADNGQEGFTFSNRAMFETFRAFMASPVYNPFETPIPLLGSADACPDDEVYCEMVSFYFRNDRPLPVWDRHDKENVLLVPGVHEARIASWNKETGDPIKLYTKGDNTRGGWIAEGHFEWPAFANELKLGHARWDDFVKRAPFDPLQYRPRAYHGPVADSDRSAPVGTSNKVAAGNGMTLDGIFGVMDRLLGKR